MSSFKSDYAFGKSKEEENKEKLETQFGVKLKHIEDKFSLFDFISEDGKVYVELKSRYIKHDEHSTALIGANKVEFIDKLKETEDVEGYFCFCYTDGLYYIKYDKKEFDKLNVRDFKRRDRTDYDDMPKPHYFIWSDWLKKIEEDKVDELTKLLSVNYIV